MKWLSQFSLVMRSSLTTLREKIEDPERMLHQLIIDMEEELERVRASVAEAVADEILMRKRADREASEAERWMERAMAAMKRSDEITAQSALSQKLLAEDRAARYSADHAKQQAEVSRLRNGVHDLEDKIRQARQKKTLLTARIARAESTRKISSALDRAGNQSAFAQFSRLEAKVEREEAMVEAWDRMEGHDPDVAELERQFEEQERKTRLSDELEALRKQINS
ncbi:MAG: PspA/IM30 family protein [Planctomycetaceae bacterium]|nr:PspA/IM30 family protein [Planctomycetaceae bacterium]